MRKMYRLFFFVYFLSLAYAITAQEVDLQIADEGACFVEGKDTVLCYQAAPRSLNGAYTRANYIHPLYTLDGEILTEDFPEDHPHHRGIFWAWHQLYIGDKRMGDGWATKDFSWEVPSMGMLEKHADASTLQVKVLWKSPLWKDDHGDEKALVSETTTISVYPTKANYRQIDIEISMLALEPNMRIGGSEDQKGYGGFSPRIRLVNGMEFTGSEGSLNPQNLPLMAGKWMDISGPIGSAHALVGLSILCHPDNPGFPHPWILRAKGSMQNAVYPGAQPISLSEVEPTVLRYRLLVHEGNAEALDIAALQAAFEKQ